MPDSIEDHLLAAEVAIRGYREQAARAEAKLASALADRIAALTSGRCLADVTHRDDEHRQSVCVLPADHRTAHDDLLGCTWTDAEHHEPGNPARKPEDAPRTSARVEHTQSDPGNGRPSDRNLAPLRGTSGRPRITGKPGAWRPVCPLHPDVAAFLRWDVAEIAAVMHHRYCQEDQ